jgi:ABC-type bacteriocin/lantibiotic exporter with double-glycine peptidase domain
MSTNFLNIAKVQGSSYKVAELIITQPKVLMAKNGKTELGPEGTIDVKNVVFRYPTMPEVAVLKNVTINAPSNKVLAFVGASGKLTKVLLT